MEYFKFWARAQKDGPDFPVVCWGYSNESQAAALSLAEQKAEDAIKKLASPGRERGGYYSANPLKERVVKQIVDGEKTIAVVTRNAYGALVLNTANVAFLDIDLMVGRLSSFFNQVPLLNSPILTIPSDAFPILF